MPTHLRTLTAPLLPAILLAWLTATTESATSRAQPLGSTAATATTAATPITPTAQKSPPTVPTNLTLTVIVTGADNPGGQLGAALYSSAEGFPNKQEKATQTAVRPRTAPVDSFMFKGLTAGPYAVSVYHDQNSNTKLDANLFGVPKEPWGTTGTIRPKSRAPRFTEAMITVTTDTRVEIRVER